LFRSSNLIFINMWFNCNTLSSGCLPEYRKKLKMGKNGTWLAQSVDSATWSQGSEFNPLNGCRDYLKIKSQRGGWQKGKGIGTPSYAGIKNTWFLGAQNWYTRETKKFNWYILKEHEDRTIETLSNFQL